MSSLNLTGTWTAIVTPLSQDGESIDVAALDRLVDDQIAGGITGLVACGTTGEAPTLTDAEQLEVVRRVAQRAKGRAAVIAGTGTFSTKKTIAASRAALEAGAQGVMVVMPYYSKPSQDGLREHVLAIARAVPAPIVLYNIPGRCIVDLAPETTEKICEAASNVVAMKEATGNVLRCQELKRRLGERLTVLSGDDGLTLPMMAVGASGVISVTSNLRPAAVSAVTRLVLAGDFAGARRAHLALLPLHEAMFLEPNPAPVKAALAAEGKMTDAVRLPLTSASAATRAKVAAVLASLPQSFEGTTTQAGARA